MKRGQGVIVNFATGFLEVREKPTHLTLGPSHRTDRPALASQDEISSQEGRADTVRPSCVAVQARAEVRHQACGTSFSSATLKARWLQTKFFWVGGTRSRWPHFSIAY